MTVMTDPISRAVELLNEAQGMLRHTECRDGDATRCPACSLESRLEPCAAALAALLAEAGVEEPKLNADGLWTFPGGASMDPLTAWPWHAYAVALRSRLVAERAARKETEQRALAAESALAKEREKNTAGNAWLVLAVGERCEGGYGSVATHGPKRYVWTCRCGAKSPSECRTETAKGWPEIEGKS